MFLSESSCLNNALSVFYVQDGLADFHTHTSFILLKLELGVAKVELSLLYFFANLCKKCQLYSIYTKVLLKNH